MNPLVLHFLNLAQRAGNTPAGQAFLRMAQQAADKAAGKIGQFGDKLLTWEGKWPTMARGPAGQFPARPFPGDRLPVAPISRGAAGLAGPHRDSENDLPHRECPGAHHWKHRIQRRLRPGLRPALGPLPRLQSRPPGPHHRAEIRVNQATHTKARSHKENPL